MSVESVINLGEKGVAVVGAGLTGCLLALALRKFGLAVTLFESRPDPRLAQDQGRSINLVMTSRGINSLTKISDSLAERVMKITVPVFGRELHSVSGDLTYQPYGPTASHCNFSVSRWELNTVLLSAAEEEGCKVYFSHPLTHVDIPQKTLYFYLQDPETTRLYQKSVKCGHIFGADGGGSRCRQALKGFLGSSSSDKALPLRYGYKELYMPRPSPSAKMDPMALHIWPRGTHFLMALPNKDYSYTMTLYMPEKGDLSFESLKSPESVRAYFLKYYPDAVSLMPDFEKHFFDNPNGFLGTVFTSPWVYEDHIALFGDAAHAVTPFFGQGCNCGFEDISEFVSLLEKSPSSSFKKLFAEYDRSRKPNGDAIANMALENFHEMMSKTADKKFLLQKEIEIALSNRFPDRYVSRYVLVTHSLIPYDLCRQIGVLQEEIIIKLSEKIQSVDQLDFEFASQLMSKTLDPFMKSHNILPKDFNYHSKYYPKSKPSSRL